MTVPAAAFWRGLDISGWDAARVIASGSGYTLFGQAVFLDPAGPAALRYVLDLAPDWSMRAGRITGFLAACTIDTRIVRGPGGWTIQGRNYGMPDVVDLDLGFTPATNMAQLKRLGLSVGDEKAFDVAWLDAGDETFQRLRQRYRRVGRFDYAYDSPTADYRATIMLAPNGFAADYPGLWAMEA
jgi:hypothetical protein